MRESREGKRILGDTHTRARAHTHMHTHLHGLAHQVRTGVHFNAAEEGACGRMRQQVYHGDDACGGVNARTRTQKEREGDHPTPGQEKKETTLNFPVMVSPPMYEGLWVLMLMDISSFRSEEIRLCFPLSHPLPSALPDAKSINVPRLKILDAVHSCQLCARCANSLFWTTCEIYSNAYIRRHAHFSCSLLHPSNHFPLPLCTMSRRTGFGSQPVCQCSLSSFFPIMQRAT